MPTMPAAPATTQSNSENFDSEIDSEINDVMATEELLTTDLLCLSHLRWDFVFQRPQHLLTRFATNRRVFFFEEPHFDHIAAPRLDVKISKEGVHVATPILPHGLEPARIQQALRALLDDLIVEKGLSDLTLWYYTPMALKFSSHLDANVVIYDCMDELSLFKHAPPELLPLERDLLAKADVVFTGGQSIYESKKDKHPNIHSMPSSIEFNHFAKARSTSIVAPADQAAIPGPRIGFFGVLDERFDIELIREAAQLRPDWHFVMIGPIVKIDPKDLPQGANLHYLGMKTYQELPTYIAGWDAAILPFARNESTRFISPTKTPEYLAAGRPVVSTSIRDVVRPYGDMKLVEIADEANEFVAALERAMQTAKTDKEWRQRVDKFLALNSWDQTFHKMATLEAEASPAPRVGDAMEMMGHGLDGEAVLPMAAASVLHDRIKN